MTYDVWAGAQQAIGDGDGGRSRYERLARFIREAVQSGQLRSGEQLPTVREMASHLGVSVTTVVTAYRALREDGVVQGEVGRGTFVRDVEPSSRPDVAVRLPDVDVRLPASGASATWRRRALANTEHRLTSAYPDAIDLMHGSSNSAFLPLRAIKRALQSVARELTTTDIEYPVSTDPEPELVAQLLPLFARDGIVAEESELMLGTSTIQFISLGAEMLRRDRHTNWPITAAVEEPGYQAAMDALERFGCALVGMATDEYGVRPEHLRAALDAGATLAVLTPRASNPVGTTWTEQRRRELADVIATHPDVLVIEDDYFADAAASRPGSLLTDDRIAQQILHVRSFAKVIAPDLRIAAALAKPALHSAISRVKYSADGWMSRTTQRVLAKVLAADDTADLLAKARATYAARRSSAEHLLAEGLRDVGGSVHHAHDGLYTWIRLPPGTDAGIVAEHTARQGYLVAPGEPFFIRPGTVRFLRLNGGSANADEVAAAANAILLAIKRPDTRIGSRLTP